eukprot:jgi/Mesvir1/6895/Mv09056-RA.1
MYRPPPVVEDDAVEDTSGITQLYISQQHYEEQDDAVQSAGGGIEPVPFYSNPEVPYYSNSEPLPVTHLGSSGSQREAEYANLPDAAGPTSTLTEPVMDTFKRDVNRVISNLKQVVFQMKQADNPRAAVRDWDLWGPAFFVLFLATTLSISAGQDNAKVFSVVFASVSVGAVVLTLNVLLLGGNINFFQSLSLLGYCVFPMDVAMLFGLLLTRKWMRIILSTYAVVHACVCAYPFMRAAVTENRRMLALYPVCLMYMFLGMLLLAL